MLIWQSRTAARNAKCPSRERKRDVVERGSRRRRVVEGQVPDRDAPFLSSRTGGRIDALSCGSAMKTQDNQSGTARCHLGADMEMA
jgi:hypothetical protein